MLHHPACPCAACKLIRWQAQKYRNQFYVDPSLPVEELDSCPMYDQFRFCPHGAVCFLPHAPPPPPPRRAEDIVSALVTLDGEHDAGHAVCGVCGSREINHFGYDRVLPTAMCTRCCQPLYCPTVPELAEAAFERHPYDYQAYKSLVDELRARIPNSFRIAFAKEAHRIGCSKFAWSLISEEQVVETLQTALAANPSIDRILSVGASSGYVEYLYKRAAQARNLPITLECYDEIPNPRFDVAVVAGGPEHAGRRDRRSTLLLLCWPPFGSQEKDLSTMGFDTLSHFLTAGGESLVYIGDESSTGDFRFHGLLAQRMRPAPIYRVRHEIRRWVPQDMGMVFAGQDTVGVYLRREYPLAYTQQQPVAAAAGSTAMVAADPATNGATQ